MSKTEEKVQTQASTSLAGAKRSLHPSFPVAERESLSPAGRQHIQGGRSWPSHFPWIRVAVRDLLLRRTGRPHPGPEGRGRDQYRHLSGAGSESLRPICRFCWDGGWGWRASGSVGLVSNSSSWTSHRSYPSLGPFLFIKIAGEFKEMMCRALRPVPSLCRVLRKWELVLPSPLFTLDQNFLIFFLWVLSNSYC